jgi:2-keto-3-deoxy-L-rhamnonate aldolase RhmA
VCKLPKVVIVAPADKHAELRRTLGSLEYDIAATVATADDAAGISGDVAIAWEPDEDALARLRAFGFKTVAVGEDAQSADMTLGADDVASFKTRIWELFRPA